MSERYIATFRAQFTTEDDVEAQLVAADILEAVAQANILEESDSINVTQIVPMGLSLTAEEVATQLRLARNLLIKTRIGPLFELAKEITKLLGFLRTVERTQWTSAVSTTVRSSTQWRKYIMTLTNHKVKALVFGRYKTGKTWGALTFPRPVMLDFDRGVDVRFNPEFVKRYGVRQIEFKQFKEAVTVKGGIPKDHIAAFPEFGRKGSRWFDEQCFLFVYDSAGTCTFHATIPELIGKNLMDLRDMNGKPLIRFITDVCRKPQRDAHGWVFYLWQEKNEFEPEWKSAYVRKVIMPESKVCVIGAGHHYLKIEKVMVQENVQSAVDLLTAEAKQVAFKEFLNPASRYSFLNTFIWVTDERGLALVDPAFPEKEGRDLTSFRDAIGRHVMKEIIDKLRKDDEAWVQYLWPRPGAVAASRKLAYVKKVRVGEETLLVGSDFFLAAPIWMKE